MPTEQERLLSLLDAVRGAPRLLILTHNDPDPDAIASAVALGYLLAPQLSARIAYRGIIGRAENKALVDYLCHPLHQLSPADWDGAPPVALVDTQPGAGNNVLPAGYNPTIVLDHHALRDGTSRAVFADVRSEMGATSTILTGYLRAAGVVMPPWLATALFYGIKTDTMGLSRGTGRADVDAYFYLQPQIEINALSRIERAQVPAQYFRSLVLGLQAARIYKDTVIVYLGWTDYPDLTAEIADMLLRLEDIQWVVCMGAYGPDLILSVRTTRREGAEKLVHQIVDESGTAGGHGALAGGEVPLLGRDPEAVALHMAALTLAGLELRDIEGKSLI